MRARNTEILRRSWSVSGRLAEGAEKLLQELPQNPYQTAPNIDTSPPPPDIQKAVKNAIFHETRVLESLARNLENGITKPSSKVQLV